MTVSQPEAVLLGVLAAAFLVALFLVCAIRRPRRWTAPREPDPVYKAPPGPIYRSPVPAKPTPGIRVVPWPTGRPDRWRAVEHELHHSPEEAERLQQVHEQARKASKPVKGYCLEAGDENGYRWLWHNSFRRTRSAAWDSFLKDLGDKKIRALPTRRAQMAACKRLWHLRLVPVTLQRQPGAFVTYTSDPMSPDEASIRAFEAVARRGAQR